MFWGTYTRHVSGTRVACKNSFKFIYSVKYFIAKLITTEMAKLQQACFMKSRFWRRRHTLTAELLISDKLNVSSGPRHLPLSHVDRKFQIRFQN
jgi:hypothetical protein